MIECVGKKQTQTHTSTQTYLVSEVCHEVGEGVSAAVCHCQFFFFVSNSFRELAKNVQFWKVSKMDHPNCGVRASFSSVVYLGQPSLSSSQKDVPKCQNDSRSIGLLGSTNIWIPKVFINCDCPKHYNSITSDM